MSKRDRRRQAALEQRLRSKWEHFSGCGKEEQQRLLDHTFAFRIDDVGAGWEYVHFELDGKTAASFRISYIGPGVRDFVGAVTGLAKEDIREVVFYDEPGEYTLLFARNNDAVYIELPTMKKGFFLEYAAFADQVMREYKETYRY